MKNTKKKKLGEILRERGQISQLDLAKAVSDQQGKVIHLGELLLDCGLVSKAQLASALADVTRAPYIDCGAVAAPSALALGLVSKALALKCTVLPLAVEESTLVVVMAEPQNLRIADEIRFTAGMNVSTRLGFRQDILAAIEKYYGPSSSLNPLETPARAAVEPDATEESEASLDMEFVSTSSRQANRDAIQEVQAELLHKRTPVVRIVSEVIQAADEKRASDIHIEPQADGLSIRIRVDGVLRDLRREPRAIQNALISRIKILSDMDIAERRAPQDGRFLVRMPGKEIDFRVSTLPTQYGEKVVMRLLNSSGALLTFSAMKMPEEVERSLRAVLSLPQGMLLVTGPTGSGKSTTLYAALNLLRQPTVNIVTVEDPVEYVLPGINQVHVNNKAGLTFASCMRSILRQDPNVIMVGEIRDKETAEIAMKAAQTGHLVLSTLHTNDSLSAVTRLADLGIPGFMIASSVTAIVAQRLVRCLCVCRALTPVSVEMAERLASFGLADPVENLYSPVGCDICDHTGYRGRTAVYEVLLFDDAIREAVRAEEKGERLRALVQSAGMKLMQEDALDKILQGVTSIDEVARIVPIQKASSASCPACGQRTGGSFSFCRHCGARAEKTAPEKATKP